MIHELTTAEHTRLNDATNRLIDTLNTHLPNLTKGPQQRAEAEAEIGMALLGALTNAYLLGVNATRTK